MTPDKVNSEWRAWNGGLAAPDVRVYTGLPPPPPAADDDEVAIVAERTPAQRNARANGTRSTSPSPGGSRRRARSCRPLQRRAACQSAVDKLVRSS